jgi:hypothetical protein
MAHHLCGLGYYGALNFLVAKSTVQMREGPSFGLLVAAIIWETLPCLQSPVF